MVYASDMSLLEAARNLASAYRAEEPIFDLIGKVIAEVDALPTQEELDVCATNIMNNNVDDPDVEDYECLMLLAQTLRAVGYDV